MKKLFIIIIGLFLLIPGVKALELTKQGITIDIPATWTYYTREDRTRLEKYYKNNIYLEAYDNKNDALFIRIIDNPGINTYNKDADLIQEVFGIINNGNVNTNMYSYIESGDYKWIKFEYTAKNTNMEIIEYYLCVNKEFITITIQPEEGNTLSTDIKKEADDLIKSIKITGNGISDGIHINEKDLDYNKSFIQKYGVELLICIMVILCAWYFTRKKR